MRHVYAHVYCSHVLLQVTIISLHLGCSAFGYALPVKCSDHATCGVHIIAALTVLQV